MHILSARMQSALTLVRNWCLAEGLNVNPNKTIVVPFTKRRKVNLISPTVNGTTIAFSKEVRYLGVILDQRLNWNSHLERTINKAITALWACRRLLGKTWGLRPNMTYWSYITVIRPIVTYASLVWWPKVEEKTTQGKLQKLQRLACLSITGATKTCPTAALEVLLNILPLHLHVEREALLSASRVIQTQKVKSGDLTESWQRSIWKR
jgi:hypothetical protein